jgi:membrane-bound metal-dependent hydrolase YbcI (DUF457 family)
MRERGHVINAVLLGVGIGILLQPSMDLATLRSVVEVGVPVILGALLPDVDTSFGAHRVHGHNILVLVAVLAFPLVFNNLAWVWLGVVTHYVLDLLGNVRGMALLYPLTRNFYDVPVGVNVDSPLADVVTLVVTGIELAAVAALIRAGRAGVLADPSQILQFLGPVV